MKLTITVQDSIPASQIAQLQNSEWYLDVHNFIIEEASSNHDTVDELTGTCQSLRFNPVSVAEPDASSNWINLLIERTLPKLERWFLSDCKKELRIIREQSLLIRKKLKFHDALPEVPTVVVGAIAAAAAVAPPNKKMNGALESVRPYLETIVMELALSDSSDRLERLTKK